MKNPFMLWGSYIGLGIGLIGSYFSFGIVLYLAEKGMFEPWGIIIMVIPMVIGFMGGWFIHALLQKYR